eukprot:CAMPEP_0184670594 /NCGR_PEP_ID=MMETSP0308-20130426/82849_1 /TAXON_ID=38269 /ORGANISM="Gloeochaete witrockiana, Strain SAG 46.84" /LENGTH=158 /DNA_ID=CAMNT_0027117389 /DNA_START=295 /DNA_END=771 /DNA_ORIENTATION=-
MRVLSMESQAAQSPPQPLVFVSIPAFHYQKTSDGCDDNTCSICINEYQVDEELRALPCAHRFHRNCIDPWLKGKHTCPLCKLDVSEQATSPPPDVEMPTEPSSIPEGIWVHSSAPISSDLMNGETTASPQSQIAGVTALVLEPISLTGNRNSIVLLVR